MSKLKYSKRHPSVFSYKTKKATKYGFRITYYDSFHKRRESQKRGFDNEMDAYRASLTDQTSIAENNSDLVKNSQVTVKQYGEAFSKSRRKLLKRSSYLTSEGRLKNHIYPAIGNLKLSSITKTLYTEKVINMLVDKNITKATIQGINRSFLALMNAAVEDGIITKNPLSRIKIPRIKVIDKRIMSKDELKQFNTQLKKETLLLQVMYFTLQQTGLRRGEVCGIKWEDVDLDKKTITVNRTRDCYGIRTPKTVKSYRTVSMSQSLVDLYKLYREETKASFEKSRMKFDEHTFVLQSMYNNPINAGMVSTALRLILKRAGLGYLVGQFTTHYFRHMYASFLLNSGVPVTEVSKSLGHSSPDVTLKIYLEANPKENINLADKFNDLW